MAGIYRQSRLPPNLEMALPACWHSLRQPATDGWPTNRGVIMSAILISLDHSRRVAIGNDALSDNTFRADFLLNPDGNRDLSVKYGHLRVTVTGDSMKLPDAKMSELQDWIADAVAAMIASKP
jgi:hypothetical protein